MTPHDEDQPQSKSKHEDALEMGNPSPVLVIFLIIPLLGILAALLMVAAEMRNQRAAQATLPQAANNPAALVNYAAPDFQLPMLDGRFVSLETYRGKVLFLNFWQTTCVPCITEMPEFSNFMADQNPDEVALLAINVAETAGQVREFFARNDIVGIPTALDTDSTVREQYALLGFPTTFVIDKAGVVRSMTIGAMNYDEMAAALESIQTDADADR